MNVTNVTEADEQTCTGSVVYFLAGYEEAHLEIELTILLFGTVANIINIIVLTRKNMRTAINVLLTALSIADLFLLANEIPIHIHCLIYRNDNNTTHNGWFYYAVFEKVLSKWVFNRISTWMTVLIGIWRVLMVFLPFRSQKLCTMKRSYVGTAIVYVLSVLLNIQLILLLIRDRPFDGINYCMYIDYYDESLPHGYYKTLIIIDLVILALNKCVSLASVIVISCFLIVALRRVRQRRQYLSSAVLTEVSDKSNKVTLTLLSIVVVFFVTHFPVAVIFLILYNTPSSLTKCYERLARFADLLIFINSSVNFVLYCKTSDEYRKTFSELFGITNISRLVRTVLPRQTLNTNSTNETIL